ncbi:MAG: DNA methyltransferase [Promethearchaeota archaeon]
MIQSFQDHRNAKFHPAHSIHRWYGKLMPSTPYWAMKELTNQGNVVYDPFCGSGTVCLEAMLMKRQSVGNDIDPLACLISRVKTRPLDLQLIEKEFLWIQSESNSLKPEIPDFPRRDYWFNSVCQIALGQILAAISQIENKAVREFFLVCFSAIVRMSSRADPKFIITARSKHRQPIAEKLSAKNVWQFYTTTVTRNIKRMKEIWSRGKSDPRPMIHCGDAREYIPDQKSDLIVTNPPYIGSVNYVRAMRLPRYWLKLSDNDLKLKKSEIGLRTPERSQDNSLIAGYQSLSSVLSQISDKKNNNEAKFRSKRSISKRTIISFINDVERCFLNLDKALRPNGMAVIRIGDNKLGRSEVKLGDFFCELIRKIGWIERLRIKDPVTGRSLFGSKRFTRTNPNKLEYSWILVFQKGD